MMAAMAAMLAMVVTTTAGAAQERGPDQVRAREIGIAPGVLAPGPLNAITDVEGVRVGQVTLTDAEAATYYPSNYTGPGPW